MSNRSELVEEAAEHVRKSRFPKAIELYRTLLAEDPENPQLRAELADVYWRSKNLERAFHHFHKSASIFIQRQDVQNALQMLIAANSVSPGEPDILFRMCECLKASGRIDELNEALPKLVSAARASGDRRRAWALEELAQLYPEDLEILSLRATTLAEAGRVDDAVVAFKDLAARHGPRAPSFAVTLMQAAAVAKDRVDLGINLAQTMLAGRKPHEALQLLVSFYEEFPEDIGILETLLAALIEIGAHDKIVPARIELIKARVKRDQKSAGLTDLRVLLEQAPDDPKALEVAAHAYLAFNDRDHAVETWRHLAHLTERLGLRLEHNRAVLALLKARPDDEEALVLGSRALRQANHVKEAEDLEGRLEEVRKKSTRRSATGSGRGSSNPPRRASSRLRPPTQPRHSSNDGAEMLEDADVIEVQNDGGLDSADQTATLPEDGLHESMPITKSPYVETVRPAVGPPSRTVTGTHFLDSAQIRAVLEEKHAEIRQAVPGAKKDQFSGTVSMPNMSALSAEESTDSNDSDDSRAPKRSKGSTDSNDWPRLAAPRPASARTNYGLPDYVPPKGDKENHTSPSMLPARYQTRKQPKPNEPISDQEATSAPGVELAYAFDVEVEEFSAEEITSRMEALVLDEVIERENTGKERPKDPRIRLSDIPHPAPEEHHEPTQPRFPESVGLISDLLDDNTRRKSKNGKPGKRRPKTGA